MWWLGYFFSGISAVLSGAVLLAYLRAGSSAHRSEIMSLTVWLVMSAIFVVIQPFLYEVCLANRAYSGVIWYGCWALLDFFAVLMVFACHRFFVQSNVSRLALFVVASFCMAMFMQIVGLLDRVIIGTKALDDVYRFLILSINFSVAPVALIEFFARGRKFKGIVND